MSDQQPPEEQSKFQWLPKYWEESETTAKRGAPLVRRVRDSIRHWLPKAHITVKGTDLPALPAGSKKFPTWAQLKYLPEVLTVQEQKIAGVALLIAVASFGVLGVRFVQSHLVGVGRDGGSYTEGVVGEPQYINPILALNNDVDLDLTRLMFQGLYKINDKGEAVTDLVTHEELSQDGKTYIFTIRQDAKWQDGEPLTASDIVFTYDRILDPEAKSPLLKTFQGVAITAVDDHTVQMTLPQPYAPFLSTLTVGILPEHLWVDIPAGNITLAEYNVKPVGSGPYMFQSLTKDRQGSIRSFHLTRYTAYDGNKPHIEDITFRFYPTQEDAGTALKRHQVEGLSFITQDEQKTVAKYAVNIHSLHLPQYTAVFFNQKNELLKDKVVRQSLERAVSRPAIIDQALGGAGEPIYTPILPGFLGYNSAVQGLAFDQEAAKKALDNDGWTWTAGDTVRKKGGKDLQFALTTVDRPEYTKTAQILRDAWASIGVGVEIRLFSSNDILKKAVKPRDYEALLFGEIIGTDPDPYPFWHSSQSFDPGLNLATFYNKQVDQLLEEARQTSDPDQRRLKYLQFQNILADEEPALFLYNPDYLYVLPRKIKGFPAQRITFPSDRFNGIEQWYIKTKLHWR